jgi:hypothetical protein
VLFDQAEDLRRGKIEGGESIITWEKEEEGGRRKKEEGGY